MKKMPQILVKDWDTKWDRHLRCTLYALESCGVVQWYRKQDVIDLANGLFPELIDQIPDSWVNQLSEESRKFRYGHTQKSS